MSSPEADNYREGFSRYSLEEALDEASTIHETVEESGISLNQAERKVSQEKFDGLVDEGRAMEAIRLVIFTWKSLDSEILYRIHDKLRELMENAETDEEYNRLAKEWDDVEEWYRRGSPSQ